jgi:hypothetical protein
MKKIKTFEDACKALKINFTPAADLTKDELAYMKLKIIAKALNEGWVPNWNNWDEWKYYPWLLRASVFRTTTTLTITRLRLSARAFALNQVSWPSMRGSNLRACIRITF